MMRLSFRSTTALFAEHKIVNNIFAWAGESGSERERARGRTEREKTGMGGGGVEESR